MDTLPGKNRKRFQYSLRALLACIFLYGLGWALTVAWGVSNSKEKAFSDFEHQSLYQIVEQSDNKVTVKFAGDSSGMFKEEKYVFRGSSPFPFYVVWDIDMNETNMSLYSPEAFGHRKFLWIFGWTWPLNKPYYEALQRK